jgi:DNA repair protein RecN (Recombination protein N)
LRPEAGLELLDRLGGNESLREKVASLHHRWTELGRECDALERQATDQEARQELLEFQATEIEKADIHIGEDEALQEERKLLVHEEKLSVAADDAYRTLYEEEASVLSGLARVRKRVSELAEIDSRLAPFVENESSVSSQLEDLALFLRDYREQIRFTPGRLDQVEERLGFLERLKKKYGGTLEAVLAHRKSCRQSLEQLENKGERLAQLRDELASTAQLYMESARDLSARRRQTANQFAKRVERELRGLAMEKARFSIEVSSAADDIESKTEWKETGLDDVELLFSANPGEELRTLSRIASGGECSRFMLAIKSLGTKGEQPKTLVFDEVDVGIEGRVADVVGEKLKDLARTHQVICITHLPQIASFADVHYRIEKATSRGRTATRIQRLDRQGHVDEIARMLAGAVVTESARRHAEQLVSEKG